MELETSVRYIKGIGEKKALALNKLGVFSLRDLISFFPRKYEDRSVLRTIGETMDGESACIEAMVADTPNLTRIRRGLDLVKFRIVDSSGAIDVTFFNQPYAKDNLHRGESYYFFGKIELDGTKRKMINPVYESIKSQRRNTGRIVPIYKLAAGLNQRGLQQAIEQGLEGCASLLPEIIPDAIRRRNELVPVVYAYENIHFPKDFTTLELARRRLIFEELFTLALALKRMRGERNRSDGILMDAPDMKRFWDCIPFSPTAAQVRAIADGISDMSSGKVMNRLIQGDVGSGKTLIAAALVWQCYSAGYVSAFMAPTEILAEQHFHTLSELLAPLKLRIGKLTGSMSAKEKRLVKAGLLAGDYDLIIGTHALFSEDIEYTRLGLVIADEQHRFGVNQRSALVSKGARPHVLVMSATPIPRTMALIIYGDLDISVVDELPPGRQKVDTFAVDESYRSRLNSFILKQVELGRQVFIVCPMVEENEDSKLKLKSAEEHAKALSAAFPQLKLACVHGKMKAKDKEAVMAAFVAGETDVLVSTTVIEVGVDVPNATLMIIENAERFGLSQLHQLRGRVGRGKEKSYCILVTDNHGDEVSSRLDIMCKTNDGFKISEEDLRLRGPGDFFGARQHGLPEMHVADLGTDIDVLQRAQDEATKLLEEDPGLNIPEHKQLKEQVDRLFAKGAEGFN